MSFFNPLGALESVGTFFSDELSALENFVNWLSSDFINFFNTVSKDIQNFVSFIGQAISDIPTFMQKIGNYFLQILQNFVQTASSAISGFISWFAQQVQNFFQDLANVASGFLNAVYDFFTDVANAFATILSSIVSDFLSGFGQGLNHVGSAISQISQFLTPFIVPITIGKFLPTIVDKLAEILPEIEIDLSPVGLGGKVPIKFGEIVKAFAETAVDFLNEVRIEAQNTLKEFIKEPFISDFKISAREIFNEIGLGDLPFADPPFQLIAKWVSVRSFDEVKDHLEETILLTGYPEWFTDAYLSPPIDDFVPGNPLFRSVPIREVILASQYGILDISSVSQYAYNNLITPKTAKLMYQNQTARLLQRAAEEGIRQFIVTPEQAYQEIINSVNLSGKDLFLKYFKLEYNYAVQRIIRQFLRSLLSRALSDYGRPYVDLKYLETTVNTIFKELNYPKQVQDVFNVMIAQSQLIYSNQLILNQLEQITRLGIFDENQVKKILKTNNFNEQIALEILNFELQYSQLRYQISQIEDLVKKGYLTPDDAVKQLNGLGMIKAFADIIVNYANQEITISSTISILKELLRNFLIDLSSAESELRKLKINENLINEIIKNEYNINIAKLQLSYVETLAKNLYYDQNQLINELSKILKDRTAIDLYAQKFYYEYIFPKIVDYYVSLARHGIIGNIKNLPKEIVDYEINPEIQIYQLEIGLEYIKSLLKDLEIKPTDAVKELEKLGMQKDIANLFVQIYTPTFYDIHTIIRNIIEGQLYKVGKIPINLGNAESELKKLGIPDDQIKILLEQYASSFGLEIWKQYIPKIEEIEKAFKYNYPIQKLVELSFIPSEFVNLYLDVYQQELIGEYVHTLKDEYINTLIYGISNAQLENLLRQYGINDVYLGILRLTAQIKKLILGFSELYLTPSKALSVAEYVSNPTQFLQKVFSEFQVPSDLQNTYLEYTINRRVRTYVNEIISTISLLFEKGKIDLGTAQSLLQQLQKYGLTNDEIQLILLNWQLRSNLSSS